MAWRGSVVASLDAANEDGSTFGDHIPAPPQPDVTARLDCERLLRRLGGREERIIRARLGIGEEPVTLGVAGKRMGFSRERARQLEAEGLKTMREMVEPTNGRKK